MKKNKYKLLMLFFLIFFNIILWEKIKIKIPLFENDYGTVVLDEKGNYLRIFLNSKQFCILNGDGFEVPEKLKKCVINFEDKRFYYHFGIDLFAMIRATGLNMKNFSITSGGSTITMQLARLSAPKKRNLINKVLEAIHSIDIESKFGKEDILRMYLNHAPYGGNIVGYRAASLRYFGKFPDELTWAEAATLAVLPNNPGAISPNRSKDKLKIKRDRLLKKLFENKIIDQTTFELAVFESLPEKKYPFTFLAPQLTSKIDRNYKGKVVVTTISKELQQGLQKVAADYISEIRVKGVYNCSIIVVDTKSGEVKAYIGSGDYYDSKNFGQVDGIRSKRSTGSILKPFLYALSIDKGLILPETKLEDIPSNFNGFSSHNSNMTFKGLARAQDALIMSLNAPAVKLLREYEIVNFYNFLKTAGLKNLNRSPDDYGLPLIVGGAEATPWDIAQLYYGLGNYGNFSDIKVVKEEDNSKKNKLLTTGSAYLVLDILQDLKRPGTDQFWKRFGTRKKIAWKTGTSYGNKDAWAAGVTPEWTIVTWVGNFDGKENTSLVGLETAAPLFFNVFEYLSNKKISTWFNYPEELLHRIKTSAETGYRATKETLLTKESIAPIDSEPLKYCPYEKPIFLNRRETEEVCSLCWENGDVKKITKLVYSPEVIQFLKNSGTEYYSIPSHRKSCPSLKGKSVVAFIYPNNNSRLIIPKGIDGSYQKVTFKAAHSYKKSRIFWYLDNSYIGLTEERHEVNVELNEGKHTLYIIDSSGISKEIHFYSYYGISSKK